MKDSSLKTQVSRQIKKIAKLFSLVSWVLCLGSSKVYACPTCSELIVRGKDAFKAMKFGEGIAWSIGLFFLVPVFMIGGMIYVIYRSSKKTKQKEATGEMK